MFVAVKTNSRFLPVCTGLSLVLHLRQTMQTAKFANLWLCMMLLSEAKTRQKIKFFNKSILYKNGDFEISKLLLKKE
jgi:hypothetical protein